MNAKDLTLNIAVNLGRVARWVSEGKVARVPDFLDETDNYLKQLAQLKTDVRFNETLVLFDRDFQKLKRSEFNQDWAEEALTWANILTHRAKLA